eukprot:8168414-Ditylum_brightwellii.AAC.1
MDASTAALDPSTVDINAVNLHTMEYSMPKAAVIPFCLLPLVLPAPLTTYNAWPLLHNHTNKPDIAVHPGLLWALLDATCTTGTTTHVTMPTIVIDTSTTFKAQQQEVLPPSPPTTAPM